MIAQTPHVSTRVPWHVRRTHIVFAASKILPGVGIARAELDAIKDMQSGTVTCQITDTTLPTSRVERPIEYTAPCTLQNREPDYATDWGRVEF